VEVIERVVQRLKLGFASVARTGVDVTDVKAAAKGVSRRCRISVLASTVSLTVV
jgi:hypothetical protein